MTIQMDTDSFTESPGFNATYTALLSSTEWEEYSKSSHTVIGWHSIILLCMLLGIEIMYPRGIGMRGAHP